MSKKILVVDDSVTARAEVKRALRGTEHTLLEAEHGAEALEQLEANPDVALVLCDLNMPVMNGLEFLANVNRDEFSVVMLTTECQPDIVRKAKELGAKGWVVKPFEARTVLGIVEKLAA